MTVSPGLTFTSRVIGRNSQGNWLEVWAANSTVTRRVSAVAPGAAADCEACTL